MHAAANEAFSRLLIETLQRVDPGLWLYCMEASVTYRVAVEYGQPVIREFYADRDYDRSGSIVFTRRVGRLDPRQVPTAVLRAHRRQGAHDRRRRHRHRFRLGLHPQRHTGRARPRARHAPRADPRRHPDRRAATARRPSLIQETHDGIARNRQPAAGHLLPASVARCGLHVAVDATVAAGAVVGLEVMKQFTEIEADAAGRVVELLVEDGEPVDAGRRLMRIEG